MTRLQRWTALAATVLASLGLGGCTTTSVLLSATGVVSDSGMTWEIVKHLHGKLTEGDARPCALLDSVERALNPRCGAFVEGSLQARDIVSARLDECALTVAARDPRLWAALPELMAKGARPEACAQSPLVALAQAVDCPDLAATTLDVRRSFVGLSQADARAIHFDVVRWLSCPASRAAGLDVALGAWLDSGALNPGTLPFSPLGALHPSHLGSDFSAALEARGHTAQAAFGGISGQRTPGFEAALRSSDWAALDWWLTRQPQLANRVPAQQGNQLAWLPLARVLTPEFLTYPASRGDMVAYLMVRGADPRQRLPSDRSLSVIDLARTMKSPLVEVLAQPSPPPLLSSDAWRAPAPRLAGE